MCSLNASTANATRSWSSSCATSEDVVPTHRDVHLVLDNYATHHHAAVYWLAARPRFHVHYAPTYASWLNTVEIWFNIMTQRAIRRGTFRQVRDLIAKIEHFVRRYNRYCLPFVWTARPIRFSSRSNDFVKLSLGQGHSDKQNCQRSSLFEVWR